MLGKLKEILSQEQGPQGGQTSLETQQDNDSNARPNLITSLEELARPDISLFSKDEINGFDDHFRLTAIEAGAKGTTVTGVQIGVDAVKQTEDWAVKMNVNKKIIPEEPSLAFIRGKDPNRGAKIEATRVREIKGVGLEEEGRDEKHQYGGFLNIGVLKTPPDSSIPEGKILGIGLSTGGSDNTMKAKAKMSVRLEAGGEVSSSVGGEGVRAALPSGDHIYHAVATAEGNTEEKNVGFQGPNFQGSLEIFNFSPKNGGLGVRALYTWATFKGIKYYHLRQAAVRSNAPHLIGGAARGAGEAAFGVKPMKEEN